MKAGEALRDALHRGAGVLFHASSLPSPDVSVSWNTAENGTYRWPTTANWTVLIRSNCKFGLYLIKKKGKKGQIWIVGNKSARLSANLVSLLSPKDNIWHPYLKWAEGYSVCTQNSAFYPCKPRCFLSIVIPSNPGLLPGFLSFFLGLTQCLSFEEVKSLTQSFWYFSSSPPHLVTILLFPPLLCSSSVHTGDEKTEIMHPWGHYLAFGRCWQVMLLWLPNQTNYFSIEMISRIFQQTSPPSKATIPLEVFFQKNLSYGKQRKISGLYNLSCGTHQMS